MRTQTSQKIIDYIEKHGQVQAHELHEILKISRVAVHKHLKNLISEGKIEKKGSAPIVFYTLKKTVESINLPDAITIHREERKSIEENFLSITPDGNILYGFDGFLYWYKKYQSKKDIIEIADEYHGTILQKNRSKNKNGAIDATEKLQTNFKDNLIKKLFVADIYSVPVFGRTKLAKLVMYAKQVGDQRLVEEISISVKSIIEKIISNCNVDSVVFVPPTVPRPVQFMDLLEKELNLGLEKIKVVKVIPGEIPVPQKTLSTLEERIINARDTFFLKESFDRENILLIDDVVRSGASLHEIAAKLKKMNPKIRSIYAFGLVGNIKGYDVVRAI